MIGFHFDDTEWDEKENCLREESLYNTNDKTFEHPNHDKVLVYCGKTGWRMEDKQEKELMNDDQWEHFKAVWESYGVKFTHDDGTLKSTYEISKEMAQVFEALSDDKKEKNI